MQTKTKSSSNTAIIAIILILTFPLWIGILGASFGLVMGVFGAVFGVFAGLFGAVFGGIGALIGWLFNGLWGWPGVHVSIWGGKLVVLSIIVLAIILVSRRTKS